MTKLYETHNFCKKQYFVKNKKDFFPRLKFLADIEIERMVDSILQTKDIKISKKTQSPAIFITKRQIYEDETSIKDDYVDFSEVVKWLHSAGIDVKKVGNDNFYVKNHVLSRNRLLIFANKKRLESGINPFHVNQITKY